MKYLEDNVVASSTLIHTSMQELERATSAAATTLSNAVNAFNQLNYTKFLENVRETYAYYFMLIRWWKISVTPRRSKKYSER